MNTQSLLGLELGEARAVAESEGFAVRETEVSSRKGVAGNSARVIRARELDDGSIELCYSIFKTDVRYTAE